MNKNKNFFFVQIEEVLKSKYEEAVKNTNDGLENLLNWTIKLYFQKVIIMLIEKKIYKTISSNFIFQIRYSDEVLQNKINGKILETLSFIQELRDEKNMSPLHWACKYNNVKAVFKILSKVCNVNLSGLNNYEVINSQNK